jgi:hypothetical protein
MKWEISTNNMEFFLLLPHKENIINIELKNIKKEAFGRNVKTLNQMNIITKTKNLLKKPNKHYKKYNNKKFDKKKIKCFKCKKYGHFANDCKVKQKINQLQINDKEKEDLYKILELRNTDSENDISPDEIESSSFDEYSNSSSSPDIKLGCNDNCCKSINALTKSLNVLTKQEEQEELLLEAISKINDLKLKANMLHKLRKMINKEKTNDFKTTKPTISLFETLERFNKLKPKKVNLEDLQLEVNQIKNEIKQLKNENNKLESKNVYLEDRVSILKLNKKFELINNQASTDDIKVDISKMIK